MSHNELNDEEFVSIEDSKELRLEAKRRMTKLRELLSKDRTNSYIVAETFYHIQNSALYMFIQHRLEPDRPYKTFKEFVSYETDYAPKAALDMCKVWDWFYIKNGKEFFKRFELAGISWSKMVLLVNVATVDNVDDWIAIAQKLTLKQLKEQVTGQAGPSRAIEHDVEEGRILKLRGPDDLIQVIEEAVNVGRVVYGEAVADPAAVLGRICHDFRAQHKQQPSASDYDALKRMLKSVESRYRIKIIAFTEDQETVITGDDILNSLEG
jgi:hypothetical protein